MTLTSDSANVDRVLRRSSLVLDLLTNRDTGGVIAGPNVRLQTTSVLLNAIRAGLALLTWEHDAFAYAENYDESAGRYRGLRFGALVNVTGDDTGLLVRPGVARRQIDEETTAPAPAGPDAGSITSPVPGPAQMTTHPSGPRQSPKPKRALVLLLLGFHGCRRGISGMKPTAKHLLRS
jgi:hypothetical protein